MKKFKLLALKWHETYEVAAQRIKWKQLCVRKGKGEYSKNRKSHGGFKVHLQYWTYFNK